MVTKMSKFTKEEKLKIASIVAEKVVAHLKNNNSKPDDDILAKLCADAVIEAMMEEMIEKGVSKGICPVCGKFYTSCECENDLFNQTTDNNNKDSIELSIYGSDVYLLNDDFIRTFSSGELHNYIICKDFLQRKHLQEPQKKILSDCSINNPAYFTHIELSAPVVNPLFIKGKDSILSILLDIPTRVLKDIIEHQKYLVMESHYKYVEKNDIISLHTYLDIEKLNQKVVVSTGVEAIRHLLENFDLNGTLKRIAEKYIHSGKVVTKKDRRRIKVIKYFIKNKMNINNIIISVLAVPQVDELLRKLPERTRENVKISYAVIADSNESIIHLESIGAPEIVINNAKRMLQDFVEKLFNRIIKICLCQGEVNYHSSKDIETVLKSLFNSTKDYDISVWKDFIAMLLCVDICSNTSEKATFQGFLVDYNAFEDKLIWDDLSKNTK